MCGVAGIIQFDLVWPEPQLRRHLQAMADAQAHRGPDDHGIWVSGCGRVGFAHRRLSIIDLTQAAHQPMLSADGRYCVTFNGEIYNYRELRHQLERSGCSFATQSDTEVLIEAYRHYGEACVEHFDGMFAFAIFDQVTGQLFAARDPFGEKPFYYAQIGNAIAFSSELHALTSIPEFSADISIDAVSRYLALQYFDGEETLYTHASKLLPGHTLTLRPGLAPTVRRYFEFMPEPMAPVRSEESLVDELEHILLTNIERRLRADVPVGAFLSGGVDSSTVVALASKCLGRKIQTFSIGFKGWLDSEHEDAEQMARHIGTEHRTELLDDDVLAEATQISRYVDEPNGDTSLLPTFLLSRLARKHVKVVLSGDGADEIFGGYSRYFSTLAEECNRLDSRGAGARYYSSRILVFTEDELSKLMARAPRACHLYLQALRDEIDQGEGNLIGRLRKTDIEHYLPGAVLAKVDRMSMRHGLEVRTPFLNLDMARFAQCLPEAQLADGKGGKYLLKRLAERYIPREWLDRPKRGFGLPSYQWGNGKLFDLAQSRLVEKRDRRLWWLGRERASRWLAKHQQDKDAITYKLWSLLHLEKYLAHHPGMAHRGTDMLQLRSLTATLSTRRSPVLFLARRFPAAWRSLLRPGSIALTLWCADGDAGVEFDWEGQLEGLRDEVIRCNRQMPSTLVCVDIEREEAESMAEQLWQQGVHRLLVYDDMEWVELRLSSPVIGGFSPRSGHAPLFFDGRDKSRIRYTWRQSLQELAEDVTATFTRSSQIDSEQQDCAVDRKYGLFNADTPTRALNLIGEVVEWIRFRSIENKTRAAMRDMLANPARCFPPTDGKKLLFVLPGLYPGGAERQACNLMVELARQGYQVKLLTLSPLVGLSGHYAYFLSEHSIEIIHVAEADAGEIGGVLETLPETTLDILAAPVPFIRQYVWPLFSYMLHERPYAVVNFLDHANLSGGIAALLAGVQKVLVSFRNINPTHFDFYQDWYARYYEVLKASHEVIWTGNSIAGNKSYAKWLGMTEAHIDVFRNGIDFEKFPQPDANELETVRQELGASPGMPVVGGVFRLAREKHPNLFVDTFKVIAGQIKGVRGFIVGDGPLKAEVEDYIRKSGLEGELLLLGRKQNIGGYLAFADVVLQTSDAEGTSNTLLEAQYLNTPVVATRAGGTPESLADRVSGYVVDSREPEHIAERVIDLLHNTNMARNMGQAGHDFVLENFSLDQSVNRLKSLLEI